MCPAHPRLSSAPPRVVPLRAASWQATATATGLYTPALPLPARLVIERKLDPQRAMRKDAGANEQEVLMGRGGVMDEESHVKGEG